MYVFFMSIPEACRLMMGTATVSVGNEIGVFDMDESPLYGVDDSVVGFRCEQGS